LSSYYGDKPTLQSVSPTTASFSSNNAKGVSSGVAQLLKNYGSERLFSIPQPPPSVTGTDTLWVGITPNDTVTITGTYLQNGPVVVVNNGLLIIHNANATILGNFLITASGRVLADSSTLYLPQQYFYQRNIITVGNSLLQVTDCSFNFGGMNHSMALLDSSTITFTRVHNNDWTTTGTFGRPSLTINGTNMAGEVIISGAAHLHFSHADTLLPWFQFPASAIINTGFPNGDTTVQHFVFNDTVTGISGVNYSVIIDTCKTVWWGLMPTNGSDVTINNSYIRSIGLWFQGADSVSVSGLIDNSTYTSFTAPLSDRNMQLNNSSVTTWSLYPMDSSYINVTSCILGEIGAEDKAKVFATKFFLDGSGGYFWASGNGLAFAGASAFTSNVRSEQNGIVLIANCSVTSGAVSAIANSILLMVQSTAPQPPIPYDGSVVWDANIGGPATAFTDTSVHISGSAWIDRGPTCVNPMDFDSYALFYQPTGASAWTAISSGAITTEVHESELAVWNTHGLAAGNYNLLLVLKDNFDDSVNAVTTVTLLPGVLNVTDVSKNNASLTIYPNPATLNTTVLISLQHQANIHISINDMTGRTVKTIFDNSLPSGNHSIFINTVDLNDGVYFIKMDDGDAVIVRRVEVMN